MDLSEPRPQDRKCFTPPGVRHQPRRGDDVVRWLKGRRADYHRAGLDEMAEAIEAALDDYRLRADTGQNLVDPLDAPDWA